MKDIYERHPSNTQYSYQKIYIIYTIWEKAARVARAKFQKLPSIRCYGDLQESSIQTQGNACCGGEAHLQLAQAGLCPAFGNQVFDKNFKRQKWHPQ